MSWTDGNLEVGYLILRVGASGATLLPPGGVPLPFNANAYQDPLSRPDQFECYAAVPISPVGVLGSSDWLCAAPNTASPTGRPGSFSLRLDQGNLASLSWTAPGGQQSFVLAEVPLNGSPSRTLVLPATTLSAIDDTEGIPTCYVLVATVGTQNAGNSEMLCALPGLSNLYP